MMEDRSYVHRLADSMQTDEQYLLQELTLGNKLAFEKIYELYWEPLYNAAYKRLKRTDLCKDVVQDIFVTLWKRRKEVQIENLKSYLFGALKFQILKVFSKSKSDISFITNFSSIIQQHIRHGVPSEYNIEYKELESLFQLWLQTLSPKRKQVFELYYLDNLTTREIADELQISQKTVQNHLGEVSKSLYKRIFVQVIMLF